MMDDPVINIEHSATSRYITVMFRFGETSTEYVAARFNDPENPDETSEAERERQIGDWPRIPIKPVARFALTREGLEQLVTVLHQTLENHDKVSEIMAQMQRTPEGGEQ